LSGAVAPTENRGVPDSVDGTSPALRHGYRTKRTSVTAVRVTRGVALGRDAGGGLGVEAAAVPPDRGSGRI